MPDINHKCEQNRLLLQEIVTWLVLQNCNDTCPFLVFVTSFAILKKENTENIRVIIFFMVSEL
jgi:hypothetical protein